DLARTLAEVLDIQHGSHQTIACGGRHQLDIAAVLGVLFRKIDDRVVEQLDRGGAGLQDRQDRVDRRVQRAEGEDGEALCLWPGKELELRAERDRQRALTAAQQWRQVEAAEVLPPTIDLLEDHVQAVAGVATNGLWEALADQGLVPP